MTRRLSCWALVIAILPWCSLAAAEEKAPRRPNQPDQPNAFGQPDARGLGGGFGRPDAPGSYGSSTAAQRLQQAQADLSKAQAALKPMLAKLRAEFENGAELKEAKEAVKQAQAALDKLRKPILEGLNNKDEWKAAEAEVRKAKDVLENVGSSGGGIEQRAAAAQKVMALQTVLTKMESEAMTADPKVAEAQKALVEASTKLVTLRKQFDENLTKDPAYETALKDVESAKQRVDEAKKDLQTARQKDSTDAQKRELDRERKAREDAMRREGGWNPPQPPVPPPGR